MFARRHKVSILVRLRDFLWPRIGFKRAGRYIGYRLVRLPGTPYQIAGGFAWGAAISFTPFVGLHFIISGICAWFSRSSIIASAIGTVVGNPWTFPFIWALVYGLGTKILGIEAGNQPPPLENLALFFDSLWHLLGQSFQWLFGLIDFDDISSQKTWALIVDLAKNLIWPMLVGSIPCMVVVWLVFYVPLNYLVKSYQKSRRRRMAQAKNNNSKAQNDAVDDKTMSAGQ